MSAVLAKVGVLPILDAVIEGLAEADDTREETAVLREARAAVEELIDVSKQVVEIDFGRRPLGRNAVRKISAIADRFARAVARVQP